MDVVFAVCQKCFGRTLEPKLSEDGTRTLCPDCKSAEIEEKRIKEYPLLKAKLAAVTAERDRMRETIEKCLGKAHHLSQLGVDPATRISIAGEIINICMKSLESEAPND